MYFSQNYIFYHDMFWSPRVLVLGIFVRAKAAAAAITCISMLPAHDLS